MGIWNDGLRSPSPSHSRRRSSPTGDRHYSSRPSNSRSASSFNLFGTASSSGRSRGYSSRARPRSGFINRIRKFLRDVYSYMRRHPLKVFVLVIMPLLTGGALTKLLSQFGVRLPRSLENLMGGARGGGARNFARGGARDFGGGSSLPGMMGGGMGESLGGLMNVAKMFI